MEKIISFSLFTIQEICRSVLQLGRLGFKSCLLKPINSRVSGVISMQSSPVAEGNLQLSYFIRLFRQSLRHVPATGDFTCVPHSIHTIT